MFTKAARFDGDVLHDDSVLLAAPDVVEALDDRVEVVDGRA